MDIKGAGFTPAKVSESTGLQPVVNLQPVVKIQEVGPQADRPKEPAPQARPVPDPQQTLERVAARLREYLAESRRDLEFRVDHDAGATVVTVRNANTGEVIRQIPNEEALRVLRRLNEGSATLLDSTA
jgi:flagellar protein FlaG